MIDFSRACERLSNDAQCPADLSLAAEIAALFVYSKETIGDMLIDPQMMYK